MNNKKQTYTKETNQKTQDKSHADGYETNEDEDEYDGENDEQDTEEAYE